MKFAVDSAHRDFFKNHRMIEFASFFSPEQIEQLYQLIRHSLSSRLNLEKASSAQLFMAGRDLWRTDDALRKLVAKSKLADIAADLTEERAIRLGYDQYLPPPPLHLDKADPDQPYIKLLQRQETTLEAISSFEGLLCGVMIGLQPAPHQDSPLFPILPGHVVYFDPTAPLNLALGKGEYLLIVYTRAKAIYILQPDDPHTHALKRLGYVFGDTLSDKWHPMLKR
jgi:hypothetical protein